MKTKIIITSFTLFVLWSNIHAQIQEHVCGTLEEADNFVSQLSQDCLPFFTSFRNDHNDDMIPQGVHRTLKLKTNVIFVQKDNGEGNFSLSNPDHVDYWERVFDTLNYRLQNMIVGQCNCSTSPLHYNNTHIEFLPSFIELRNSYYWNHRHDADSNILSSATKPYLTAINNLAAQTPGYEDGFNWIITTDSIMWKRWTDNNGTVPIWDMGYNCIDMGVYTKNNSCVNYSAYPTTNLSRPAFWHNPDKYLVFVNAMNHVYPYGQDWVEENIPKTAGGALHEYGHYFGLTDISNANCLINIMDPSGGAN